MSGEEQRRIFAKNLNALLEQHNKTQIEVANAIGVLQQTFNTWTQGLAIPRMDKIQKLADYFGVPKSYLVDEHSSADPHYYIDDEARDMAEFLFTNPEYKVLFDASRKVRKEDIEFVRQMLERMSNGE